MPPASEDKDFLGLSPNDQTRYLQDTDPDFKSLSSADQAAYLAHLTNQPLQEQPKEGVWNAAKRSFAQLNPFGESKPQPIGDINAMSMNDYQERKAQHGVPYAIGAGVAQAVGADVPGMEASAERGDPGGVIGHALPGVAMAAAPLAVEGAVRGGMRGFGSQPVRTLAKGIENFDLTKPFQSMGNMGDYWRESSPRGRMLAKTNQALTEGRASAIPTTLKPTEEIDPVAQAVKERRAAMIPMRIPRTADPVTEAIKMGRAAKIPITSGAWPEIGAHSPIMVRPGDVPEIGATSKIPVRPGAVPKIGATERIPVTPGFKTPHVGQTEGIPVRPGAAMRSFGGGGLDVTFIPEPRPTFSGEEPNYMGSVNREELNDLALRRKPGAGRQMQQLGKPIIYIPNGSDLP